MFPMLPGCQLPGLQKTDSSIAILVAQHNGVRIMGIDAERL